MGIRYDRDTFRATNGPLIFFSDPSSKEAFAREVRGALISGLSFYSYRMPQDLMISFGSSEGIVEGIDMPGFVISPFDPNSPVVTIPYKGGKNLVSNSKIYSMPERSTTREEYTSEVNEIISDLKDYDRRKVVAARVELREDHIEIAEIFFDFMQRFPEAMIFCFSTPVTGCWIGASPELLLEGHGRQLKTMALAGTRPVGSLNPWDEKNIEEQRIVSDYIIELFKKNDLNPIVEKAFTKPSGNIEHICTPIKGDINNSINFNLESLLKELSPTPALCGYPKDFALNEIKRLEKFPRGYYGGFCGPYHSNEDFIFHVVLRCASVEEKKYCIYVGGGVTAQSDAESEWKETEAKALNIFPKDNQ